MNSNMYIIQMRRSKKVWLTTVLALVLPVVACGPLFIFEESLGWLPWVIMLLTMTPVYVVTWLYAPQTLMLDRNTLTIGRRVQPVEISLGDIRRVERVESKVVRRAMRTVGNGGLWAYTGRYYHRAVGNYQLFATELNNLVLIETDKKKYVISSVDERMYKMLSDNIKTTV
ncbi:MAG: hypothetical protein IKY65_01855 [Rikenellaceae bacterium]|nr:hypothetical protein [Rikenellaceae bacterium]